MSEKREVVFGVPVVASDALKDPRKVLAISGPIEPYLALRRDLLTQRRPAQPLEVLPTDRQRFDLPPWAGMILGMVCVPSPITPDRV